MTALFAINGLAYAAFLASIAVIARRLGHSRRGAGVAVFVASIGSPGLVALFLLVEDNVAYFPILPWVYYLLLRECADLRAADHRNELGKRQISRVAVARSKGNHRTGFHVDGTGSQCIDAILKSDCVAGWRCQSRQS